MSGGGTGVPAPQDDRVSRRWFLERMAWVSSAAAAGTLFSRTPAAASPRGPAVTPEAFAANVRLQEVDDLTLLTMSESMTLIRTGALDPRELVEAYVDRIEAFEGTYQAYADRPSRETLPAQLARTPADERRAPLRGMCLAPKDNCYTADLLTEGGSLVYEGFQPDYDAT
ncbi:MAG: amidase family protein, partial [Gammaproteobacteria bacterium]|nr:amidase family protein [Gammaproteobacteria bacterium]